MPQETLIGADGQAIRCWRPLPNHWFSIAAYPTIEDMKVHMRKTYPQANRPDLWEQYPSVFK